MSVQRRAGLVWRRGQPSRARRHGGHGQHRTDAWTKTLGLSNTGTSSWRRMIATDGFVYETCDHSEATLRRADTGDVAGLSKAHASQAQAFVDCLIRSNRQQRKCREPAVNGIVISFTYQIITVFCA